MRAHLSQLVLHAGPDAAEVDRVDAIEELGRLVGRVGRRGLNAGVVESQVQTAELTNGTFDHRGDLSFL